MVLTVGSRLLHRYVVVGRLGEGGLGSAYHVRDEVFGRELALKVVESSPERDPSMLYAEFERLRQLAHPCLARVHDFGWLRRPGAVRAAFFTSDRVAGVDLETYARGRTFSESLAPLRDALTALALLHRAGLRHGDFKPANVMVSHRGGGVLIDLSASAPITRGGVAREVVSGTPGFIAPEQLRPGRVIDRRADLFAVGKTLASLVAATGHHSTSAEQALIARLTHTDPAARPADVDEVLDALGVHHPVIATAAPRPVPLLERGHALDRLEQALRALLQGEAGPRAIAIVGERGTGRSRLLREAKWRAQRDLDAIEGHGRSRAPVRELMARALERDPGPSPAALLEALEQLRTGPTPVVLLLDDLEQLDGPERRAWLALAETLEPTDPVMMLWTATPGANAPRAATMEIELGPLTRKAIALWAGELLPASQIDRLVERSGGKAAFVARVLERVAARGGAEGDWDDSDARSLTPDRQASVLALDSAGRNVLALVAAAGEVLPTSDLGSLGAAEEAVDELVRLGFVTVDASGARLASPEERDDLLALLGDELPRAGERLSRHFASRSESGERDDRTRAAARTAEYLALAGDLQAAETWLRAHEALTSHLPEEWSRVADTLVQAGAGREPFVAKLFHRAGRPAAALSVWARALGHSPSLRRDPRALASIGDALLDRGEPRRAVRWLEAALRRRTQVARHAVGAENPDALDLGVIAAPLARALLRLGRHTDALGIAEAALGDRAVRRERAALLENAGIAKSYLGDARAARDLLDRAARLHGAEDHARAQVRALEYRAFVDFRAGDAATAVEGYARALALAETSGVRDRIVHLAVSLGATCHQLSRWGEALAHYERGLRAAIVLGERSPEIMLRFDVAKLYADIGLHDRAARAAERALELARREGLKHFEGACLAVLGEVASARLDWDLASLRHAEAHAILDDERARREATEVKIQWAEAHHAAGHSTEAAEVLAALEPAVAELAAPDVTARHVLARARSLAGASPGEARELLERARALADSAGQGSLAAEIDGELSRVWASVGARHLAAEAASRAVSHWERVGADLPDAYHAAFWSHPHRSDLVRRGSASVPEPPSARSSPPAVEKLRRLIDINKKLNSTLRVRDVLRVAMDTAIELTGAERGFVLLREGRPPDAESLRVAVAQNIDKKALSGAELAFSQSIARDAIAAGRPVITLDAGSDHRFSSNESVHAMQLKSVVCVPIHGPDEMLGAMYLDNRFRPAAFVERDIELLLAFADQVAIALTNARLHAHLEQRTRELESEKRRVERLVEEQAAEIDRLAEEVREKQSVLEHRYDYSSIVGRGPRMQQVLARLDRVIPTTATVLIEGESGTGKELIARAIHFNGSRKAHPFVTINCGAVPESLLESELFGHVRGAFTGADRDRKGLFEAAHGGTLFLDEIGEMPLAMQVKLLRVLQEHEVRPVGSTRAIKTDVRVVAATNRDLREEVPAGRFREDLFYRLGVVEIDMPPLRERPEDIPLLASHLVERIARSLGREVPTLRPEAVRRLMAHAWPGNIRELENVLTNAVILSPSQAIGGRSIQLPGAAAGPRSPARQPVTRGQFRAQERETIARALAAHDWNISEVARALGQHRSTLYRKLERYGLLEPSGP